MQFFAIPILALLATGTLALPNDLDARAIEARVNCNQILPACNGGSVVGQTNCRCSGQVERCDLWSCPGSAPNVMVCGQRGTGCVWI
ncbi:signal peptide-containing protein [Colletotrichum incanum]|uniref:Signal peptide-containing protein n=1 Tax=Colletotrichum incanum TaxID=1573173 RepID=A0A167A4U6_COLIC|nr:signal peptide-containing protein [Colletotrichum incanum]